MTSMSKWTHTAKMSDSTLVAITDADIAQITTRDGFYGHRILALEEGGYLNLAQIIFIERHQPTP